MNAAERERRTKEVHYSWKTHFHPVKKIRLPAIDSANVQMAKLGPFKELYEDYMEPYSCIFTFMSILTAHMGDQRLENFIMDDKPFQSKPLNKECIPRWMVEQTSRKRSLLV